MHLVYYISNTFPSRLFLLKYGGVPGKNERWGYLTCKNLYSVWYTVKESLIFLSPPPPEVLQNNDFPCEHQHVSVQLTSVFSSRICKLGTSLMSTCRKTTIKGEMIVAKLVPTLWPLQKVFEDIYRNSVYVGAGSSYKLYLQRCKVVKKQNKTLNHSVALLDWILQSRSVVSIRMILQVFAVTERKESTPGVVLRYSTPFMNSKNSASQVRHCQ